MKNFFKKPHFLVILIFFLAFALRLILVNWTLGYGNNLDLTRYEGWARAAHIDGFSATYSSSFQYENNIIPANHQPPGTLYIASVSYETWIITGKIISRLTNTPPGSITEVNTYLQHFFMKIPPLISDLLLGLLIYLLVSRGVSKKMGLFSASIFLFNPVILYNSAIWGQTDSLNNLFFIMALFLAFSKKYTLSILSYAGSLYIKLSLLPLVPFYFIFLLFESKKNIKKIIFGGILTLIAIGIITIPISKNPIEWLLLNIPPMAKGELQNMTIAAFNFWWAVLCHPIAGHKSIPVVSQLFLNIPLQVWGYLLFGLFSFPLLYLQIKKSKKLIKKQNIFLLFSLIAFLTFMFLPRMHDRYMYPVFPLLAVAIGFNKETRFYFIIYCLLSLFNFINVFYSWYPIVLDSTSTFYHLIYGDYLGWIISILTMIVGFIFYYKTLKKFIRI